MVKLQPRLPHPESQQTHDAQELDDDASPEVVMEFVEDEAELRQEQEEEVPYMLIGAFVDRLRQRRPR
jgi:hypothetical protein